MSRASVGIITTLLVVSVLAPAAIGGTAAQESDPVTVTVSVVDSNGNSVGGTDVIVTWNNGEKSETVTTASNGKAFVDVPEGENVEITVDDDTYVRNSPKTVFNVGEEEVEVPVSVSGQATLTVQSANGPVENADVEVSRSVSTVDELTTDENGQASTRRLEQGEYDLLVSKPGFYTNDTATLNLNTDSVTQTVELRRGTVPVTFNVVDDHFDDPQAVEGAQVQIEAVGFSARTFENGEASTSLAVNRQYEVSVSKDGYSTATQQFRVGEESTSVDVAIERTPELTVEAANSRVVVGESTFVTVTDEYGDPVSSASVSIDGSPAGETNDDGQATVPIDSEGDIEISVTDDRGYSASVAVEGVDGSDDVTPTQTTEETTEEPTEEATETEAAETDEETDGGDGESGPGFGVGVTLAALATALVLARRRR